MKKIFLVITMLLLTVFPLGVSAYAENNDETETSITQSFVLEQTTPTIQYPKTIEIKGGVQWTDDNNNIHPLIYSKVIVKLGTPDYAHYTEIVTYTDQNGNYSTDLTFYEAYFVRVEVWAAGEYSKVVRGSGIDDYYYAQEVFIIPEFEYFNITTFNIFMNTQEGRAFQIAQAVILGNKFINTMTGGNISNIIVKYPHIESKNSHAYYNNNIIYLKDRTYGTPDIHYYWETILHEYGHHISNCYGFDDSPGGDHFLYNHIDALAKKNDLSTSKINGVKLAWSEGWAHYFSFVTINYYNDLYENGGLTNPVIPNYDNLYTRKNIETQTDLGTGTIWSLGEGSELAVAMFLYDMADDSGTEETFDCISLGFINLWNLINSGNKAKTFSEFANICYNSSLVNDNDFYKLLDYYEMSSKVNYDSQLGIGAPVTWEARGGSQRCPNNKFQLIFKRSSGEIIFNKTNITATSYTLTKEEWNAIYHNNTYSYFYITVVSEQTTGILTGKYYSLPVMATIPKVSSFYVTLKGDTNTRYVEKRASITGRQFFLCTVTFNQPGTVILQTTGNFDTYMEIFNMNNVELYNDDDQGYNNNSMEVLNVSAGTQLIVRVRLYNVNSGGYVKLCMAYSTGAQLWDNIPVSYFESFDLISAGSGGTVTVTGSLPQYSVMFYRLQVSTSRIYTIKSEGSYNEFYADLYVIDPSKATLCENNHVSSISMYLEAGKTYIIVLTSYDPQTDYGNYQLTVT